MTYRRDAIRFDVTFLSRRNSISCFHREQFVIHNFCEDFTCYYTMDFDLNAINQQKLRLVDPNKVLDLRPSTTSERRKSAEQDPDDKAEEIQSTLQKPSSNQSNKYLSLISKYQALCAIMPFLSLQSNPCFLKAAKDFVQRLALTSYLLRKKLPPKACITCDGIISPSRGLSPERKKSWTLPDVLQDSSTPAIYEDTIHDFNAIRISNKSSGRGDDTRQSSSTTCYAPKVDEECYINYLERREAQETLVQQSMAEQISDYVTFPVVTSKYTNRDNLTFTETVPTSESEPRSPVELISQKCKIKPKFLDLNRLYKRRRYQKYRKKQLFQRQQLSFFYERSLTEEDPDFSIQNTVNFCMNMTSPIKSQISNRSSEDASD